MNEQLEEMAKDMQLSSHHKEDKFEDMRVEVAFKERRILERKRLAGEAADEGRSLDALTQFQVDTHNVVMDRAVEALESRFASHRSPFADFSCLDPTRFEDILLYGIPEGALGSICKLASSINVEGLRDELNSFTQNYSQLKRSINAECTVEIEGSDGEEESSVAERVKVACKDCSTCALRLLSKYRLHDNLYLAYKVLCTSVTQVNCERSLSKLKIIKSRLRSTMKQDRLEATMLMSIEKALLNNLMKA